jgi:hypothetical protein
MFDLGLIYTTYVRSIRRNGMYDVKLPGFRDAKTNSGARISVNDDRIEIKGGDLLLTR